MPTVYKITEVNKNKLTSMFHWKAAKNITCSKTGLEYEPGKFIKPRIGRIFAFSKLEDAIRYANYMIGNHEIWESYTPKTFPATDILNDSITITNKRLSTFWNHGYDPEHRLMDPPCGTIFCSSIRMYRKAWSTMGGLVE